MQPNPETADRPRPRRGPGRPPRADVRDALIGVATDLFGRRGFDAVSVEDLLQAAGVSRGTFYKHFESREALLADIYWLGGTAIQESVRAAIAESGDGLGMLEIGCRAYLEAIVAHGRLANELVIAQYGNPLVRELREKLIAGYVDLVSARLEELGERPLPPLLLDALFTAVDRLAQRIVLDPGAAGQLASLEAEAHEVAVHYARAFLVSRDATTPNDDDPAAASPTRSPRPGGAPS